VLHGPRPWVYNLLMLRCASSLKPSDTLFLGNNVPR